MKFAERMTLVSPEALYAAKLSINRDAEAGGFRDAINVGLDVVAPLYAAKREIRRQVCEIRKKDGLGAAITPAPSP
jgi:hypothetical protein